MHYYNLGLFADDVAEKYRDKPALRYAEANYSYAWLADSSARLAFVLFKHGLRSGDVVCIAHEKRPYSYALMLACLRLGLPYVILDAAQPNVRAAKILETARPRLLFCDAADHFENLKYLAEQSGCQCLLLSEEILPELSSAWLEQLRQLTASVDGSTLAYIMFTSGSTGQPKGVAVTHQNVLHFSEWGRTCFAVVPDDIFANLSPMYFDNSVFDFYVALFAGASLVPVSRQLLTDPYAMTDYVGKMQCTVWFSVPSLLIFAMTMKAMRPQILSRLRSISFGGEGYPKAELKKLYDVFAQQARIVNVYGPTECTCICSAYTLSEDDFRDLEGLPPLGCCNQNFDWFIEALDGSRSDEGELILIGPNVAAGYYNDLQRTQAVFGTLWEPGRYGKRFYRTGDLVRADTEGQLWFLGRRDNQIKHLGYRIELEEVESGLMRLPNVTQAAVVYHRVNAAFGKLFAFIAYDGTEDAKALLARLEDILPSYMIPSRLTLMTTLPKNANGKVDRQALLTLAQ